MIRFVSIIASLTLAACGNGSDVASGGPKGSESPEAAMAAGIEASVGDVGAARAASATPLPTPDPGPLPEPATTR